MGTTSLIALTILFLDILSVMCHRLITDPYPEREWESVIVSSDPIKIRERKQNQTADLKLKQVLRPRGRSFDDCPYNDFKCLYGEKEENNDSNDIVRKFIKHYSNISEDLSENDTKGGNGSDEIENENSRKSYWTIVDSQTHHHPYDDKNGWVTLDPIPWSTSKISKWQPSKLGSAQETKPWAYGPSTQRPVHQFWVSGSNFQTQRPSSVWGIATNDIITDNKPSGFPTEGHIGGENPLLESTYHPGNEYSANINDFYYSQGFKGNSPSQSSQHAHPATYPSSGNGEWILLSTTKGYSFPQTHKWQSKNNARVFSSRKIRPIDISRYHEEDLNEKVTVSDGNSNRKSDSQNKSEGSTIKPNQSDEQRVESNQTLRGPLKKGTLIKTIRRKVRLQVLPLNQNTSTSHGGLLEVDSNPQTVDEAQQEDEKLKKIGVIANVKKNKVQRYKIMPINALQGTGKGMSSKNAATLAALGAGMIPATMALLVPMALGRRRRRSLFPKPSPLKKFLV